MSKMGFPENSFNLKGKKAERLVHELAARTFLTDWCYPNPVLPNKKELCDLLVVYDQVAIIWQIKNLKLDRHGQYKAGEVGKNLRQLSGARRQLFDVKVPIELVNPRRGRERFDAGRIEEVYLVSALLGEGEEVFSFMEHVKTYSVHVFTRDFIQLVLGELDTINDFTGYLRAKESLIREDKQLIVLGGEEELLALYLANNRSFDRLKEGTHAFIDQGLWQQFHDSGQYRAKKEQDKISYGWDDIINRAHGGSPAYELVARELARPNRFDRRVLSKVYFGACFRADADKTPAVFRRVFDLRGVTYCFLFVNSTEPGDHRQGMLKWMCYIARGTYKSNRKVIGIATEKEARSECSYDFVLLDMPVWTDRNQKEMEEMQKKTGIFLNLHKGRVHEDEYPRSTEGSASR